MTHDDILTCDLRTVTARFDAADRFEAAVDALEDAGFDRVAIAMLACHDGAARSGAADPCPIFLDARDLRRLRALVVAGPAGLLAAGAGIAVSADGLSAGVGGVLALAGLALGALVGLIVVRILARRHAAFLRAQVAMGALSVRVTVTTAAQERRAVEVLAAAGGQAVRARTQMRYHVLDMAVPAWEPPDAFDAVRDAA